MAYAHLIFVLTLFGVVADGRRSQAISKKRYDISSSVGIRTKYPWSSPMRALHTLFLVHHPATALRPVKERTLRQPASPLRPGHQRIFAPRASVKADTACESMMCTPGTLASQIEQAVCRVYGAKGTQRVRLSLKRLSDGEQLDRVIDSSHELMVQQANSYIEDLTPKPFHDASKHKWTQKLSEKWTVVRDELRSALADEKKLSTMGSNVWGSLEESILQYGSGWKTLPLCDRTVWDPTNSALFPKTCALLDKLKVPLIEAFFAKMEPYSEIKPHSDMCNFVLTSHLGLLVPEGKCHLTVGNTTREWRNGHVMMFDTSILHAAENRADIARYILMLRVYHPELTTLERSAMKLVFDCLDEQELIYDEEALAEYDVRRRAVEAESRKAWQRKDIKKKR